eukprot:365606-Chlamydomonas_euryale.AAC.6
MQGWEPATSTSCNCNHARLEASSAGRAHECVHTRHAHAQVYDISTRPCKAWILQPQPHATATMQGREPATSTPCNNTLPDMACNTPWAATPTLQYNKGYNSRPLEI